MNLFLSFLNSFVNGGSALQTIMTLPLTFALIDFGTGVASALRNKTFNFDNLADIFGHGSHLLQYVIAMITFSVSSVLLHWGIETQTIATTIGSLVLLLTSGHSIVGNIVELFPPSARPLVQEVVQDVESGISQGLTQKMPSFTPDTNPAPAGMNPMSSPWTAPAPCTITPPVGQ